MQSKFVTLKQQAHGVILTCHDAWVLANSVPLQTELAALPLAEPLMIDGSALNSMDTSGAWELIKITRRLQQHALRYSLQNFSPAQQALINLLLSQTANLTAVAPAPHLSLLHRLGMHTITQLSLIKKFFAFVGEITLTVLLTLRQPARLRVRALMSAIETTGFQALPIMALLSFMIGVVLTYQMGLQLKTYGANIFIVDLLGFSIFREFGPLLTAIIVASRTGSAFTAQLGTMVLNEEIDALRTMGVAPTEILILPKLLGLIIVMPLLSIWANLFGVLGGMLMAKNMLDVTFTDFLARFSQTVSLSSLWIGLIKTPIFAMLIASIGLFQGLQVAGGADSVGRHTTRSVVQIIFCIIIADALFSMLFTRLGL